MDRIQYYLKKTQKSVIFFSLGDATAQLALFPRITLSAIDEGGPGDPGHFFSHRFLSGIPGDTCFFGFCSRYVAPKGM